MFLVDTNVVSEIRKGGKANAGVLRFFDLTPATGLYLPAQAVGEIRRGIENVRRRGDEVHAHRLDAWLGQLFTEYSHRILSFDIDAAQVWGLLMSPHGSQSIDKQIAAIALVHGLTVVTRNVQDFVPTGVGLLNPFT